MSTPTLIERAGPDLAKLATLNSIAYCFVVQCLWNLDGLTPSECVCIRELLATWSRRLELACPAEHLEGTIRLAVESYQRDATAQTSELIDSAVAHLGNQLEGDQQSVLLGDLQALARVDGPPAEGQLAFVAQISEHFSLAVQPIPASSFAGSAAPGAVTVIESRGAGAATLIEPGAPGAAPAHEIGFVAGAEVFGCSLREPMKVLSSEADLWLADRRGERVVLKIYRWGLHPKAEVAAVLEQTDRRHVVRLLDRGMLADGRSVQVLEYIGGGTLATLLQRGKDDEAFRQEIVRELAHSLDELHRANLIHRDIKPANVLVRSTQPLDLVLADFGISSVTDLELYKTTLDRTVAYSAPESTQGVVTKGSDWWSVGIIVLETLLGRHPYAGLDDLTINVQLVTRPIPLPEHLPPRWRSLVTGLLTKDHENRWKFDQVNRWLAGEEGIPVHFESATALATSSAVKPFRFETGEYPNAASLAVALARSPDEGAKRFDRGLVSAWIASQLAEHELASRLEDLRDDKSLKPLERLALAVLLMKPDLPLTLGGEVVTPGWLTANIEEAVALVEGPIPDWLAKVRNEPRYVQLRERRRNLRAAVQQARIACDERLLDMLCFSDPEAVRGRAVAEQRLHARATVAQLSNALRESPLSETSAVLLLAANRSQFVPWQQHFEEQQADLLKRLRALRDLVDEAVTSRGDLQKHRGAAGALERELDQLRQTCGPHLSLTPAHTASIAALVKSCRARTDERLAEHEKHRKLLELALRGQVTSARDQLSHRQFSDIDYERVEAAIRRWEVEIAQLRTTLDELHPGQAAAPSAFDLTATRQAHERLAKGLSKIAPLVAKFEQASGAQRGTEVFAETRLAAARLRRGQDWLQDFVTGQERALARSQRKAALFYVGGIAAAVFIMTALFAWLRGR